MGIRSMRVPFFFVRRIGIIEPINVSQSLNLSK